MGARLGALACAWSGVVSAAVVPRVAPQASRLEVPAARTQQTPLPAAPSAPVTLPDISPLLALSPAPTPTAARAAVRPAASAPALGAPAPIAADKPASVREPDPDALELLRRAVREDSAETTGGAEASSALFDASPLALRDATADTPRTEAVARARGRMERLLPEDLPGARAEAERAIAAADGLLSGLGCAVERIETERAIVPIGGGETVPFRYPALRVLPGGKTHLIGVAADAVNLMFDPLHRSALQRHALTGDPRGPSAVRMDGAGLLELLAPVAEAGASRTRETIRSLMEASASVLSREEDESGLIRGLQVLADVRLRGWIGHGREHPDFGDIAGPGKGLAGIRLSWMDEFDAAAADPERWLFADTNFLVAAENYKRDRSHTALYALSSGRLFHVSPAVDAELGAGPRGLLDRWLSAGGLTWFRRALTSGARARTVRELFDSRLVVHRPDPAMEDAFAAVRDFVRAKGLSAEDAAVAASAFLSCPRGRRCAILSFDKGFKQLQQIATPRQGEAVSSAQREFAALIQKLPPASRDRVGTSLPEVVYFSPDTLRVRLLPRDGRSVP